MSTRISGGKALAMALVLVSATVSAESWELRPAEGDVPGSAECVAHAMKLEYDTAMAYCEQAAGHSSASASALNNRGVLRAVTGDHRGAIRDFQRAGCMRSCGGGICDADSVRALVRRNLARVTQREAPSHYNAVLFRPRV